MRRSIFLILILLFSAFTQVDAQKRPVAKINLAAKCEVTSAQPVTIGDIATVEAPQAAANKIKDTVICTGPVPGSQRIVDGEYIRLKVTALSLGCEVQFSGSKSVVISGKCLRITPEQLEEAALDFVRSQNPSGDIEYGLSIQRSPREIVLPGGLSADIQAKSMGQGIRVGPNTIMLDVIADGKVLSKSSVTVLVSAVANVLVSTEAIVQGVAINDSNTKWEKRELPGFGSPILMGQENTNWVARRSIRPGVTLSMTDVELPAAVRAGDTVTVVVRCGAVSLTTSAEARQSGRIGDNIRVRSTLSNEDVRARVVSSSRVEIIK